MHRIQVADYRSTFEKKNAGNEFIGVLHLVNGPLLDLFVEFFVSPVITHFSMNHVLIDSGQFFRQTETQVLNDLLVVSILRLLGVQVGCSAALFH